MSQLYWVGSRLADIEGAEAEFVGAVTLFGSSRVQLQTRCYQEIYGNRPNQNSRTDQSRIKIFFKEEIERVLSRDPAAKFLCYGSEWTSLGKDFRDAFPYVNHEQITRLCKDKFRARSLIMSFATTIPTVNLFRGDCTFTTLTRLFPGEQRFVVQSSSGAGGEGTVIVDENFCENRVDMLAGHELVASPYINGIPVNVHIVIGSDDYFIFQPSVQFIERDRRGKLLYRGGDFAAGNTLSNQSKCEIFRISRQLALRLQAAGYRGVLGVDYLISKDGPKFIEINPRMQASSFVLNGHLTQRGLPSLIALHRRAFEGNTVSLPETGPISASFIVFLEGGADRFREDAVPDLGSLDTFGAAPASFSPGAPVARICFSAPLVRIANGVVADTPSARQIGLPPSIFTHW